MAYSYELEEYRAGVNPRNAGPQLGEDNTISVVLADRNVLRRNWLRHSMQLAAFWPAQFAFIDRLPNGSKPSAG